MENLPAKDDPKLRRLNEQRVLDTVDKVDNFLVGAAKEKKITAIYLLVMIGLILLLLGGAMIAMAVKSGGFNNFIDNMWQVDNPNKRIICFNDYGNMTFREPTTANEFKELFDNSYCKLFER